MTALDVAEIRAWDPLLSRYKRFWSRLFAGHERVLRGGVGWSPGGFFSSLLAFTLLYYFVLGLSSLVLWVAGISVSLPLLALLAVLGFAAPPLLAYSYAWSVYYTRGERMETRFHVFASILGTLLSSGMSIEEALRLMEERYSGELRDFSREISTLNRLISLNIPTRDALQRVSRVTPSRSLSSLLYSLSETYTTGAEMADVVWSELDSYLSEVSIRVDRAVTSIGGLIESFVTLAVLMPTLLGVLAMLAAFGPLLGLSFQALIALASLGLVPLVSIVVAIMADWIIGRVRP